jgi:hypothetical protein
VSDAVLVKAKFGKLKKAGGRLRFADGDVLREALGAAGRVKKGAV